MMRVWIGVGGVFGATAVAMAAVAAHGLGHLAPAAREQVRDAVQMQGWHALALLAVGCIATRGGWAAQAAGMAFAVGLVLFCGSVYALALAGVQLGGTAPAGGILLMAGWLLLVLAAVTGR